MSRKYNSHKYKNFRQRFFTYINFCEHGLKCKKCCWVWAGSKFNNGYGKININQKSYLTHRVAYRLYYKEKIPKKTLVCHTCDNPPCCNPHHLFLGTHQDNVDDMLIKNRGKISISFDEIREMRRLREEHNWGIERIE